MAKLVSLARRRPEKWAAMIEEIKDSRTRSKVACLVWWEYFSRCEATQAPQHLKEYVQDLDACLPYSEEAVEAALCRVGYTPQQAYKRSRVLFDSNLQRAAKKKREAEGIARYIEKMEGGEL